MKWRGRSTKRLSALGVLTFAALTACGVTAAQSGLRATPQQMPFTVTGKITKQSPGKLTLGTENNIVFYVLYNDQTKILRQDGSAGSPHDLREGVQVKVEGDLTENGDIQARTIEVLPEPGKSPHAH